MRPQGPRTPTRSPLHVGGAVGKNPQTGRRDGKTCLARRGLPFSGYFLYPPLNHGFVTGTGRVRWLRDPTEGTGHYEAGTRRMSESREHRLHVAGSGRGPAPEGRAELGLCGKEETRARGRDTASPSAPVGGCRVRPFPGGAGHSGEPEIASSPPLKLSVTTSHTWRFL